MPLTQLEPHPALLVIDLQKGLAGLPVAHPFGQVVERSARLAQAFRRRSCPVVLVNVTGRAPGRTQAGAPKFNFPPDWTDLMPELDRQPSDYVISKQRVGAFIGTALDDLLRSRGVTQIFITGVATSAGVEATARSAYDLGYHVVFVADAMTDMSAEAHGYCLDRVFPKLGEIDTADHVAAAIGP
jgi:nicotinamidase-related amidase